MCLTREKHENTEATTSTDFELKASAEQAARLTDRENERRVAGCQIPLADKSYSVFRALSGCSFKGHLQRSNSLNRYLTTINDNNV